MKKLILFALAIILLSGCGVVTNQDLITPVIPAQTQASATVPIVSTQTPIQIPTNTIFPTLDMDCHGFDNPFGCWGGTTDTIIIYEVGFCMVDVVFMPTTVDPKTDHRCKLLARNQTEWFSSLDNLNISWDSSQTLDGTIEPYCSTFSIDGEFIMSNVDTMGSGTVFCSLPEGYQP
jgi:uncharacterized protein YceK